LCYIINIYYTVDFYKIKKGFLEKKKRGGGGLYLLKERGHSEGLVVKIFL
jgi:hypothetical protein